MGQRLLFVDSDRRFIKDHQVALESAFDIDFAYGTDGVIQRLETGEYAAVLLCVEVSENKGYALCSAIRKNPLLAGLRVVLISAKATAEEYGRHQSLKGRADLYLHKPIDSSTLVSELTPLVPLRGVDPDNPLGDLSGADLGEEWLDSLKTELDTDEAPAVHPFAPIPLPPPAPEPPARRGSSPALPPLAIALPSALTPPTVAKDAGKVELLESRVQDLEAKLQDLGALLVKKDQELDGLRSEHERTTRNLDEAERSRAELSGLQQELENLRLEHERATRNLDEAERRQTELGELQQKLKDTEEALLAQESHTTRAETETTHLQEKLEDTEKEREDLRVRLDERERHARSLEGRIPELEATLAAAEQRHGELEAEIARLSERDAEHLAAAEKARDLEDRINSYEARIQELQNQLEARNAELAERAKEGDALKVDLAGLEATLRGQRRELADQGGRLGGLTRECETMQAKLTENEARRLELDATLLEKESLLQSLGTEAAELRQVRQDQEQRLAEMQKEIARLVSVHDQQRLELMQGIDEREGHLNRLNASIDVQRDRIAALDREKRELEGHLNEKSARLDALSEAVADLETGIRRASDLTRPV